MSEQNGAAIKPQDHFELRLPSDPQISPDGRYVAYVRTRANVRTDAWNSELCVIDRATGVSRELGAGSHPQWKSDGSGLAFVCAADGWHAIDFWQPASGERSRLIACAHEPSGLAWSPDDTQLAFVRHVPLDATTTSNVVDVPDWEALRTPQWSARGVYTERLVRRVEGIDGDVPEGHHHIFLLRVATGESRQLTSGQFDHGGPLAHVTKMTLAGRISWTPDGQHIVMSMQRPDPQTGPLDPAVTIAADVYEFGIADGSVRRLTDFRGPVCQAVVSPDGRWIAFVGFRDRRRSFHTNMIHVMPRDGGEIRAIAHPDQMEVHQDIHWLPDSSGLLALVPHHGDGCLVRVSLQGTWTTLARDVGGSAASGYVMYQKGFSVAQDGRIAYLRGSANRTDELATLAPGGAPEQALSNDSAWMSTRQIAPIETLWLPTGQRDETWQAWLVRPSHAKADERLPLILWLHGGPYLAWCPQFAILPQIWAARGYAVLMINPRGSLGYGEAFTDQLQHDFPGEADLRLLDALDAVVARGGIDADRIHVAGESAGGVLTSWLIGHTHRFASAAVIYGVLDWASQVLTQDRPDYFPYYWLAGPPWAPGMHEQYWRRSSLSLVAEVRTPTIVLCGEKDWRTPVSQSEMYYTALKLCGVDAALVRYPEDNHSLEWHPSHWLDLIEQLDRWFRRGDAA